MARVIGLSGAQGGGKTTLLNALKEHVYVDDFKVSRAVQAKLGWDSLDRVLDDPVTMKDFQETVLSVKVNHDKALSARPEEFVLVERTPADISAYTQLWCWELVSANKWTIGQAMQFLIPFADNCSRAMEVYDGNIYLPHMDHIKFEEDVHRADQKHITFVSDSLDQFLRLKSRSIPTMTIYGRSVEQRVEEVTEWLRVLSHL